jgi:U3 small nucleolar RNA-associated protein 7
MLLHEDVGYLEAEGIENTHYYTQDKLKQAVDVNTASKVILLFYFLRMDQLSVHYRCFP